LLAKSYRISAHAAFRAVAVDFAGVAFRARLVDNAGAVKPKNTARPYAAKVMLDERGIETPTALRTVQDLLVHVQTKVLPRDRVLQHILLDGRRLSEEDEAEAHSLHLADYAKIELKSRRVLELAVEGLNSAREVIPAVAGDLVTAAGIIRAGRLEDGLLILHDCMAMIDWYLDLVTAIESTFLDERPWLKQRSYANGADSDDTVRAFKTFAPKDDLGEKLQQLDVARQAQNLTALADIVEYDIAPVVAVWADELPAILAQMKAESAEA